MLSQSDPVARRIEGFDLARALAIFGMAIVNFEVALSSGGGPGWLSAMSASLQGRAAALFVVLAGVGIALMCRSDVARGRRMLGRRALFLFGVGYLFALVWSADILHFYGAYFLVAACALGLTARWLLCLCGALILGFPVLLICGLAWESGWNFETLEYAGFWTLSGQLRNLLFNGFHPVLPWAAFLLWGLWLGRRLLADPGFARRALWVAALLTLAIELFSAGLLSALRLGPQDDLRYLLGTECMPPMPLYMLAGGALATTVICGSLLIEERLRGARWLQPLVHTGQLALTLYVGHVIVGLGLLESDGVLPRLELVAIVRWWAGFCVIAVLFSHLWRRRFRRGPLEAVMRRLA